MQAVCDEVDWSTETDPRLLLSIAGYFAAADRLDAGVPFARRHDRRYLAYTLARNWDWLHGVEIDPNFGCICADGFDTLKRELSRKIANNATFRRCSVKTLAPWLTNVYERPTGYPSKGAHGHKHALCGR